MEKKEYWRWEENCWIDAAKDWRCARSITAGIDVGSVSSQAVICVDGELYGFNSRRTGNNSPDAARLALQGLLEKSGIRQEDIAYLIGTGYGRVNVPGANRTVTEIACHARGAHYLGGSSIRTILDMGGQDCKAIRCDAKGKVIDFLMNDKCAAGTGRGMEVIADLMQVPIAELGERSLDIDEEPPAVSSICVVFAKSEALGLLKSGYTKNKVIAAYCQATAQRVAALIKRVGIENDFLITGGIAKNLGVVRRIEKLLDTAALPCRYDSQIAGALGAALFANHLARVAGDFGQSRLSIE